MDLKRIIANAGILWQHKDEFEAFLQFIIDHKVDSILEIGTGFGGSAYAFGEVTNHGRVVTVDFDAQGAARINPAKRRKQSNPNFVQIIGDSRTEDVAQRVATYGPFDLVYFDTEHAYEDCNDNYDRYASMASRFIAQHDINMDVEGWAARGETNVGIPRVWRERSAGRVVAEFISPSPDPRFPRWGGLGVMRAES